MGVVLGTSGCGVAEDVVARVQSLWADEAVPVDVTPQATQAAVEVTASEDSTGTPLVGGSSGAAAPVVEEPDRGGTTGDGGTTTIPMSFARPPTSDGSGSGGGTGRSSTGTDSGMPEEDSGTGAGTGSSVPETGSTGGPTAPPMGGGLACLEGTWTVDLSAHVRRLIKGQAHGRAVRTVRVSGRYTWQFTADEVHGDAEHLRLRYSTRLADREIRYLVDVHGAFDSKVRIEGADTLVVLPPSKNTIRANETVRFEGGKTDTRRPKLPLEGRYEIVCDFSTVELRPLAGGKKAKEVITFERSTP